MAKNTVDQWDAVPGNNTDIAGLQINNLAAPSTVDDWVRNIMAQIKSGVSTLTSANTFVPGQTFTTAMNVKSVNVSAGPAFAEIRDANGNRLGYLGCASSGNAHVTINADNAAGDIILSPGASGVSRSTGDFNTPTALNAGTYSSTGASFGAQLSATLGRLSLSSSSNATSSRAIFSTPSGTAGSISTLNATTTFATSSDETLKTFTGHLSYDDAVAVITADPARRYLWKADNSPGLGWGAQTSYAVSPDLATPGGWFSMETGEQASEGAPDSMYMPWGIDLGKRTPYLWAAVSGLIQQVADAVKDIFSLQVKHGMLKAKVDAMEARLAALEGPQA